MSVDVYFVMSKGHQAIRTFNDFSNARICLHADRNAQYVARGDGVVLAYMSREGQSWRFVSRVPVLFRAALARHAPPVEAGFDIGAEPDQPDDIEDLYPDVTEAAFALLL